MAVIYELLRYFSHMALTVPHKTTTSTRLSGYDLPKDRQVGPKLSIMMIKSCKSALLKTDRSQTFNKGDEIIWICIIKDGWGPKLSMMMMKSK